MVIQLSILILLAQMFRGFLWMRSAIIVLRRWIKLHMHAPGKRPCYSGAVTEHSSFTRYCTLGAQGPFYPQSESLWCKDVASTFCPQLAEDGTEREGCVCNSFKPHRPPLSALAPLLQWKVDRQQKRLSRYWVIVLRRAWQKLNSNQIRGERAGLSGRKSKVAAPGALILSRPPALVPASL